mgnify:CR=1 FL=1
MSLKKALSHVKLNFLLIELTGRVSQKYANAVYGNAPTSDLLSLLIC